MTILGVSRDRPDAEKAFGDKLELPFPLVADPEGRIIASYGVASPRGTAKRITFVVGPDGKIFKVFPDVDPRQHTPEVLAAVKAAAAR